MFGASRWLEPLATIGVSSGKLAAHSALTRAVVRIFMIASPDVEAVVATCTQAVWGADTRRGCARMQLHPMSPHCSRDRCSFGGCYATPAPACCVRRPFFLTQSLHPNANHARTGING